MIDPSEIAAARQALGRLLAKYRKAAGLNQHQLAPHTHYGRSTIANVEVGRQNVPRDFWERCEQALSAGRRLLAASERLDQLLRQQREETARLAAVEQRAAAPASGQRHLPEVIGRLSKAMLSPEPPATDSSAPFLDDLHARVRTAWELRQQASYAALGDHLAVLIPDIERASTVFDGEDHERALRLVVHTYNATSSLLKRRGDYDLGLLAADRAVRTAATLDDPVLAAAAAYRLANVLLSATRFDGTTEVTLRAAATSSRARRRHPSAWQAGAVSC